jgi:ABC-type transport system substrate-binding protein
MGRDWNKVAAKPAGTGPWILDKLVPHERAELVRNPNYWDPVRVPRVDRVVLLPVPDPSTRVAALLSGRVDWIEAPPPDTIDTIKRAGMQVVTNAYPHIWPYMLSTLPGSPFADVRVRKAATLAISREGLVQLLNGTAMPARGMVTEGHPWFGTPTFRPTYDPEGAKKLLAEAGFGPSKPVKVKIGISSSGSGQMQPLPMNELIQQNLKEVGIDAEFAVFEWEALRARRRGGAKAPESAGLHAINNSWPFWDPWIGILGISMSSAEPPVGYNWGYFRDSEIDKLGAEVRSTFDIEAQNKLLQIMHARMVDQASWVWIVHDLNPRAMSPKVKGFVQAQNWYQDLTPVRIEP